MALYDLWGHPAGLRINNRNQSSAEEDRADQNAPSQRMTCVCLISVVVRDEGEDERSVVWVGRMRLLVADQKVAGAGPRGPRERWLHPGRQVKLCRRHQSAGSLP